MAAIRGALLVVLHGGVPKPDDSLFITDLGADDELLPALNITHRAVGNQTADLVTLFVH
jgi:hypothetical protein